MSLTTWAELHAPALKREGPPSKVFERLVRRIHDRTSPMPPRDQPPLTAVEIALLDSWVGLGAPSGQPCTTEGDDDAPADAQDAGRVSRPVMPQADGAVPREDTPDEEPVDTAPPPGKPGAPAAGGGSPTGTSAPPERPLDMPPAPEDTPVAPDASECSFYELRAQQDRAGAPYRVAADTFDEYLCFTFDLAFDKPTQALAVYPLIDNERVLHHWLLHVTDEVDTSRTTTECRTNSPNVRLLAGGSARGGDWYLPQHVGLDVGSGKFILEIHYNNIGAEPAVDRSGAKICATQKLRRETAVVSWLGNQLFAIPPRTTNFQVAGRCKPETAQPIHLLRSWPHMHKFGVRMSMQHDRADGSSAMVFDVPFSFASQTNIDASVVLQPGDSLVTTCFYDNPNDYVVSIGEGADDEMCNNFVVAYPAGALVSNWPSVSNDACLGPL